MEVRWDGAGTENNDWRRSRYWGDVEPDSPIDIEPNPARTALMQHFATLHAEVRAQWGLACPGPLQSTTTAKAPGDRTGGSSPPSSRRSPKLSFGHGVVKFVINDPARKQFGMIAMPGLDKDIYVPKHLIEGLFRDQPVLGEYNTRDSCHFAWKVRPVMTDMTLVLPTALLP